MTNDNSGLIVDCLLRTAPALYASIDGGNSYRFAIRTKGARVAKYRRYVSGEHDASMTSQMRNMLRLAVDDANLSSLTANHIPTIVDKMAGRLRVSEIATKDDAANAWISELLLYEDFDAIQGMCWRGAIRDGDSYIMVDPRDLNWSCEPAYDGFSGVVTLYGDDDYPAWACKLWSEADLNLASEAPSGQVVIKIAVYQPEQITYWKGSTNSQTIEPANGVPTPSGVDVTTNIQEWPLGSVPIIHFANLIDNYTQSGESEVRKAIAPQDVINRTLHSMVMASEFAAFGVNWSIGMEIDAAGITPGATINLVLQDANGVAITDMTPEQVAFLQACRVGQFTATNISQYTGQLEHIVKQISWVTQTPIYGVTADGNLSGEALKQLEIGLIGKIERFQQENSAAIRLLIELSAFMQETFDTGLGQPPELGSISVNWKSPEILDTGAAILAILSVREKAPGLFSDDFVRARIGGLLGLTQSQIVAEGVAATNAQGRMLDQLTGGAGNVVGAMGGAVPGGQMGGPAPAAVA